MRAFDFVDNIRPTQPVMVGKLVGFSGKKGHFIFQRDQNWRDQSGNWWNLNVNFRILDHHTFSGIA